MAGSSQIKLKSYGDSVEKLNIESIVAVNYNKDTVSIISMIDAVVKVTGNVTGTVYIFPRPGQPVDVDIRDKDEILNKKLIFHLLFNIYLVKKTVSSTLSLD